MACTVFPTLDEIRRFRTPLTQGEDLLLRNLEALFTSENYNTRTFEIYVQPNLFIGKPDFIIIEPNNGMWIIEVKDYNFENYSISVKDNQDKWLLHDGTRISSPYTQVQGYKDKLLEYAGPELWESKRNRKYGTIIRNAVFFSLFTKEDAKILEEMKYVTTLTNQDFTDVSDKVTKYFSQINAPIYRLNDDEYQEMKAIIDPGENGKNEALPDFTSPKYQSLCESQERSQKIKGAAGTGKTTVLAKRVINSSKRMENIGEILITCYNITMCNYLRDKIVAEGGGKTLNELGVQIQHYHSLYKWGKKGNDYFIVEKIEDVKYDAVFIDEGQDFEKEWFNRIKNDYLKENNKEFVIFADENQNIYERIMLEELDEYNKGKLLPRTPIPGKWNVLNTVYRTKNTSIYWLLQKYAEELLKNEETIESTQLSLLDNFEQSMYYSSISSSGEYISAISEGIKGYYKKLLDNGVSINDIAIISSNKALIADVEWYMRNHLNQERNVFMDALTTFKPKTNRNAPTSSDEEDRPFKYQFFRNNGRIKFSTIHSFKGWENPYVILVIGPNRGQDNKELIYTGLSRAKKGLYIINMNSEYDTFFNNFFSQ